MASPVREEPDSLASLEQRIVRTVEIVTELREEREIIMKDLETAIADKTAAHAEIERQKEEIARLNQELDAMRNEQSDVRTRIQKVLGQLDLLTV